MPIKTINIDSKISSRNSKLLKENCFDKYYKINQKNKKYYIDDKLFFDPQKEEINVYDKISFNGTHSYRVFESKNMVAFAEKYDSYDGDDEKSRISLIIFYIEKTKPYKIFVGDEGNTLLVQNGNDYYHVSIGIDLYKFNEQIISYESPFGNSGVPYSYANSKSFKYDLNDDQGERIHYFDCRKKFSLYTSIMKIYENILNYVVIDFKKKLIIFKKIKGDNFEMHNYLFTINKYKKIYYDEKITSLCVKTNDGCYYIGHNISMIDNFDIIEYNAKFTKDNEEVYLKDKNKTYLICGVCIDNDLLQNKNPYKEYAKDNSKFERCEIVIIDS